MPPKRSRALDQRKAFRLFNGLGQLLLELHLVKRDNDHQRKRRGRRRGRTSSPLLKSLTLLRYGGRSMTL